MQSQLQKLNQFTSLFSGVLITLPAPRNLSTLWNMGSLLSIILLTQIMTGLLLATSYTPTMDTYNTVYLHMESMNLQWLTRYTHANGASVFFMAMYAHTGRSLYYNMFLNRYTWFIGVSILILTMATAFLGYVLPINQMSYWGGSVITNLFSEVPYFGQTLTHLIWGAMSVDNPTLTRFFVIHYLLPFVTLALLVAHISVLHQTGSSNPLGLMNQSGMTPFQSYFSFKDTMGVLTATLLFSILVMYFPLTLGDDDNFVASNSLVTPVHIQPEWYFLFAYAILRAIPNKLGGVMALLMSILVLYTLPMTFTSKQKSPMFNPISKMMFWLFLTTTALLTWIGMSPVEPPFILIGQSLAFSYFAYFSMNPLLSTLYLKMS